MSRKYLEHYTRQVGKGWYDILEDALDLIYRVVDKEKFEFKIDQIKEKFGELRFYWSLKYKGPKDEDDLGDKAYTQYQNVYNMIDKIVFVAELKSNFTCESCGEEGKLRKGSWLKTSCDKCHGRNV